MLEDIYIISNPAGFFLQNKEWPVYVQFTMDFIENMDDRYCRMYEVDGVPQSLEIKVNNGRATYLLGSMPNSLHGLVDGKLILSEILAENG